MCCVSLDSDFVTSWNSYLIISRELELDPNIKTTVFGIEFDSTVPGGGIPMKE
jgi:hypothetical protein